MRIELTFPDQSQETTDLKSGTGTSSVTSPILETYWKLPAPSAYECGSASAGRRLEI